MSLGRIDLGVRSTGSCHAGFKIPDLPAGTGTRDEIWEGRHRHRPLDLRRGGGKFRRMPGQHGPEETRSNPRQSPLQHRFCVCAAHGRSLKPADFCRGIAGAHIFRIRSSPSCGCARRPAGMFHGNASAPEMTVRANVRQPCAPPHRQPFESRRCWRGKRLRCRP
jgi:hypothetical protein